MFNDLRPWTDPYFRPILYYLSNITTYITVDDGYIKINIVGVLKKYSYEEILNRYNQSSAINKKWINKKIPMFLKDLQNFLEEGLYKSTQEGEMIIPNFGRLLQGQTNIEIY